VAAIAGAAQLWARDRYYYDAFATEAHLDRTTFHAHDPEEPRSMDLGAVFAIDDDTRRFVVEGGGIGPSLREFYDAAELAHLADVRGVLGGVGVAGAIAALVALVAWRGLPRARVRRATLVAAGLVVVAGAIAAVAFEPLFLAFHELFFPQGNFLFDPARENLTLLYPEAYWIGVTLRLGATAVAACLVVGGALSLPIGSSPAVRSYKGLRP
jgi:hypothetical protein